MTHVCFNWSAGHNSALQQILPQKRKDVTFTSALLAQNSTDPLCREKDLHSRRLWKDICCRELCGENAWQVLSTWRIKFFSEDHNFVPCASYLQTLTVEINGLFGSFCPLTWPESVGENSWGLREYYVDFLYLATVISPVSTHLYLPLKEMYCSFIQSNSKIQALFLFSL